MNISLIAFMKKLEKNELKRTEVNKNWKILLKFISKQKIGNVIRSRSLKKIYNNNKILSSSEIGMFFSLLEKSLILKYISTNWNHGFYNSDYLINIREPNGYYIKNRNIRPTWLIEDFYNLKDWQQEWFTKLD